jgi:calcyclin binding protein
MVEVTEVVDDETIKTIPLLQSEERTLDANEIESLAQKYASRPSVKAHLESLVQKIRRDVQALKRMEKSKSVIEEDNEESIATPTVNANAATVTTADTTVEEEEAVQIEEVEATKPPVITPTITSTTRPTSTSTIPKFKNIDKFAFDAGSYNAPTVSIYISLPTIGSSVPKENITCDFTPTSFDFKVLDFQGFNYRLLKDNLDKDINPEKSKIIVKKDKVVIKLGKVKGEYGFDNWMDLTSKKSGSAKAKSKDNPAASIMDLMKDMYDSGDDKMKKMIGETMMKQREGKLDGSGGMGDMGGMGGMGDM